MHPLSTHRFPKINKYNELLNVNRPLLLRFSSLSRFRCMVHLRCFLPNRTSGPPRTGRSLRLIWRRSLDPRPLFTPNRSARRAIPDYFGANQWWRTCVSRNDNHSLLITSKESQLAIQFFHYMLPLCSIYNFVLLRRVNIVAKSKKFNLSNDPSVRPETSECC